MSYKLCSQPFDVISINQFGMVSPCLCGIWHNFGDVGNLQVNSLREIFNSEKIKTFQQSIIDQTFRYCNKNNCGEIWNLPTVKELEIPRPSLPNTIMLAIDINCNLKCTSCRTHNIFSKEVNLRAKLILDRLIEDYQDYAEPVRIQCDGLGDIFNSEAYREFFKNPKLPNCFRFVMLTNGNLITKNIDWLSAIKDKIEVIEISFDAATAETYKETRGGNFNSVIDGMTALNNLGIPTRTQFVVQQKNYHEILAYRDLAKQLKSRHIGFQHITRWPHMTQDWWIQNQLENNPSIDYDFFTSALREIKQDHQCGISGGLEKLIS